MKTIKFKNGGTVKFSDKPKETFKAGNPVKTNAEMLRTVIRYATKNGYKGEGWLSVIDENNYDDFHRQILFSKSFAKSVFGEALTVDYRKPCPHCGGKLEIANPTGKCSHVHYPEDCDICAPMYVDWTDHLQQAVISDDPLLYYYNFVTERREG